MSRLHNIPGSWTNRPYFLKMFLISLGFAFDFSLCQNYPSYKIIPSKKTIKKRFWKLNVEKDSPKLIFWNKMWKLEWKWSLIWTPNSLPIRSRGLIFLTWGPRAPQEGPRVPKESPRVPKGTQEGGKEHQKNTKSKTKSYETTEKNNKRKSKVMPTQQWCFI